MWILSQDRKMLLDTECILKDRADISARIKIVAYDQENIGITMGIYSEERADEILKEIFSAIKKGIEVYEMPNEEEEREKITPEQLEKKFKDKCSKYKRCKGCDYESEYIDIDCCRWRYLLDNYNVTRK